MVNSMVRITEDLLRKRSEHNECEISTLEEVSLHQQDIEKIEHIDKWCRELKILYLQSNLIPKIENVSRLKKLEYLNLALNNIEKIENLEGCESLQKLDLTVNFVGELTSIECLKDLPHFKEIYLTGNPCTEYEGYRQYVIATLPTVMSLDGIKVEKSERIQAIQLYNEIKDQIVVQQNKYRLTRLEQIENEKLRKEKSSNRRERKPGFDGRWYTDIDAGRTTSVNEESSVREIEGDDESFWNEKVPYTPESRIDIHEYMQKQRQKDEAKRENPPQQSPTRRLFDDIGKPLNINESKIQFSFTEDDPNNCYLLNLEYYKFLDTSLLNTDIQTNYIRVTCKEKVFQLRLDKEVKPDAATAKRSQVTGHLLISAPKANSVIKINKSLPKERKAEIKKQCQHKISSGENEVLEVDPSSKSKVDYHNIISKSDVVRRPLGRNFCDRTNSLKNTSPDFVDDPDVPPLF